MPRQLGHSSRDMTFSTAVFYIRISCADEALCWLCQHSDLSFRLRDSRTKHVKLGLTRVHPTATTSSPHVKCQTLYLALSLQCDTCDVNHQSERQPQVLVHMSSSRAPRTGRRHNPKVKTGCLTCKWVRTAVPPKKQTLTCTGSDV